MITVIKKEMVRDVIREDLKRKLKDVQSDLKLLEDHLTYIDKNGIRRYRKINIFQRIFKPKEVKKINEQTKEYIKKCHKEEYLFDLFDILMKVEDDKIYRFYKRYDPSKLLEKQVEKIKQAKKLEELGFDLENDTEYLNERDIKIKVKKV